MKRLSFVFAALCALAFFSCDNSSDSSMILIPDTRASSDWLFLLYIDADDTGINDTMYQHLRLAEYSLAVIRNPDGSPKEDRPSVNIVALWDGISEEKKGDSEFLHPEGAVLELGADYDLQVQLDEADKEGKEPDFGSEWKVSPNTKDLTASARDWLAQEPDMGDYKTLEGFLKWARARYKSENLVVVLNDHGAGTHKETYADTTKSLCSDATNASKKLLSCAGIKEALKAAGYTGSDKPKILCNDVCLQATAEIVYNYAGCADYMTASPNVSVLNDWSKVYANIKKGSSALDVGKLIVSAYYNTFHEMGANFHQPEAAAKSLRASGYSMFTLSFMSLDQKKAAALKTAVEKFAEALLAIKDNDNDLFNSIYTNCIKQDMNDLTNCKGLAYAGTFAYLNDLGWLAKDVLADPALSAAHSAAQALLDLLKHGDDGLIVYAWGGNRASGESSDPSPNGSWTGVTANSMYLTGQKNFQSGDSVSVEYNDDIYGLTIVASPRYDYPNGLPAPAPYEEKSNAVKNYDDWTGFSPAWGTVINNWMRWAYNL